MAFYNELEDEEGQDQVQQGAASPQTPNQSAVIGASAAQGGAGAAAPMQAPKKADRSGNFVGIKTYLDANKKQAQKLGDQTANVIGQSAQAAKSGLENLNQNFNTQAQQGLVQNNQDALSALNQGAEKLNDEQRNIIKNQASAQYKGPQDLTQVQGYQDVQKNYNQAQQNIAGAGTEEGRQQLVKQVGQGPRTAGMTNFDSLLLQSGGGREKVAKAAEAAKGIVGNDDVTNANKSAQEKALQVKAQTDAAAKAAQEAIGGQRKTLEQQIQDRLLNFNTQQQKDLKAAQDDLLTQEDLDASLAEKLGITEGTRRYGVDLSQFVGPGEGLASVDNIANADEYARYAALNQLMANQGTNLLDSSKANLAGTAKGVNYDKAGAQKALKEADAAYQKALTTKDDTGHSIADIDKGGEKYKALKQQQAKAKEMDVLINSANDPKSAKRIAELTGLKVPKAPDLTKMTAREQGIAQQKYMQEQEAFYRAAADARDKMNTKYGYNINKQGDNVQKVNQFKDAQNFNTLINFIKNQGAV